MRKADLEEMFTNGLSFRRKDIEQQCQCYPNQIWRFNRWGILVALRSMNGPDWPIGQRGVLRLLESLASKKIDNFYATLAERGGDDQPPVYVNHETIGNVQRYLNKLEPLTFNPKFGPCWFVDKNFQPVLRNLNPRDDYDL